MLVICMVNVVNWLDKNGESFITMKSPLVLGTLLHVIKGVVIHPLCVSCVQLGYDANILPLLKSVCDCVDGTTYASNARFLLLDDT